MNEVGHRDVLELSKKLYLRLFSEKLRQVETLWLNEIVLIP